MITRTMSELIFTTPYGTIIRAPLIGIPVPVVTRPLDREIMPIKEENRELGQLF